MMANSRQLLLNCFLLAHAICLVATQSITNCGKNSDHLSNVVLKLSPDPVVKGHPFTITMMGTLDEGITAGTVQADVSIKALDIIHKSVNKKASFTVSPGIQKGNQTLVIGPVSLPKLPGSFEAAGQIKLVNGKSEPVACINLNIQVPLFDKKVGSEQRGDVQEHMTNETTSLCAQPTDHLKNVKVARSGKDTTFSANLDEDLTKLSVDIDIEIQELFVKIPVKTTIPVSYTPGLKQGAWTADAKDISTGTQQLLLSAPKAHGTVKINDGAGEEVTCINVDSSKSHTFEQFVV